MVMTRHWLRERYSEMGQGDTRVEQKTGGSAVR